VIEKITKSPDTKEGADAKSGERDSGSTNYPDFAAVKKTDK
jgi:hypothetical protein